LVAPEESPGASILVLRPRPDSTTTVIAITGRVAPQDPARLGEALEDVLTRDPAELLVIDVGHLEEPDAAAVDALCRMRLVAGRFGCRLQLRRASPELRELLYLIGLSFVTPDAGPSRRRLERQAEQREEAVGVEEEGDPGDPAL
jgi:anti-anti-sigma regulatory factor